VVSNIRDVTDRKRLEEQLKSAVEEQKALMIEMNHRVKNNLAILSSLIHLKQSELEGDVDLSNLSHQIDAVQLVHEKLCHSEQATSISLPEYLNDLLLSLFSSHNVEIDFDAQDLIVSSKMAVSLGLIVNEVATNALKYGFTDQSKALFELKGSVAAEKKSRYTSSILAMMKSSSDSDNSLPRTLSDSFMLMTWPEIGLFTLESSRSSKA